MIGVTDQPDGREASAWWLRWVSMLYLALPWAIFFAGWLSPLWASAACALLLGGLVYFWRDGYDVAGSFTAALRRCRLREVALIGLIVVLCMMLSGVGGVGRQVNDYVKHNAVLLALVEHPWPVVFDRSALYDQPTALVYYIGYYLPGALAGKVGGWALCQLVMVVWTAIGVALSFAWMARLAGRYRVLAVVVLLMAGGWDLLGHVLPISADASLTTPSMDWWSGLFCYDSGFVSLLWTPQHTLIGWLAPALAIDQLERRSDAGHQFFIAALAAMWSPFVMLGMMPLIAAGLIRGGWRGLGVTDWLVGPVLVLIAGLYFKTRGGELPLEPMWSVVGIGSFAVRYGLFIAIDVVIWVIVYGVCRRGGRLAAGQGMLLALALGWLMLLPMVRFGFYNDLAMRASDPAWFVIVLLAYRAVIGAMQRRDRVGVITFAIVFTLGALLPGARIAQAIATWRYEPPAVESTIDISHFPKEDLIEQYVGPADSMFFDVLAPARTKVPCSELERPGS